MTMTDPIADMLTRIRNGNVAFHDSVRMPSSKVKESLAQILQREGYIEGFEVANDPTKPGSDHTREYVPLLVYGKNARPGVDLGTRQSLSDIGQTIAENFGMRIVDGTSFLDNVG